MKKKYIPLMLSLLMTGTSLTLISCKDDEEIATIAVIGIAQDPGNFKGDVTSGQVVTLDATKVYVLTGAVRVKDGGKLVIPAGTRIVATAGAASYVLVEQGGQLYANGTTLSPISFSSSAATPGSWGGLIICGKAPVNTGTTSSSEIGNALYGGTVSNDNSGSFTYVKIEYAGADFAAGKKFNGLSLFGVGSETKIENIAVLNGAEDGIQLYGGTVNVSNIVSAGNGDDAFVWTDGWIGTAANMYTKRKTDGTGNTGIKGMNNAANDDASPRSNPTIKNVTVLGGTTGESNGIRLYSGTYATLDNMVFSNWATGIAAESDSTVTHFNGKKKMTNSFFDTNVTTKVSLKSTAGINVAITDTTFTVKNDATGAGNGMASPAWAVGWSTLQ
jgi:hypothetical protein